MGVGDMGLGSKLKRGEECRKEGWSRGGLGSAGGSEGKEEKKRAGI